MGPHSPFLAFFAGCVVLFLAVFRLDEDCIPGWGECGRPLRLGSVFLPLMVKGHGFVQR